MRINIQHQSGILSLPDDPATLEDITKKGKYRYSLRYKVDVAKAMRNHAMIVKITASTTSPDVQNPPSLARMSTSGIIQNLLFRQIQQVEVNRAYSQNHVGVVISDITAVIPNDKVKNLQSENSFMFQEARFDLVRASDLTRRNVSQPILQMPIFQPLLVDVAPTTSTQENSFDLLLRHGIDPSIAANRTSLYADTERVHAGILQRPTGVASSVLQGARNGSVGPSFGLLSAVVGPRSVRPSDQTGLANNDFIHVPTLESTNTKTIEEEMFLNISDLGDQFYLVFSLQTTSGVEIERVTTLVKHSRNVAAFTTPIIPPQLSVSTLNGYNRLEMKQLDPNAAGIYIYRRFIETHTAITDASYVQVAKLALRPQDGTKWYTDANPSMRPTIYRVVAYNQSELKSHEFSSVVVNPSVKFLGVKTTARPKRLFVSLTPTVVGKNVQVEINDIPSGVLALRVYRRDLSRQQRLEESIQVGNTVYLLVSSNQGSRYFVTDTSPVEGRVYEYTALLVFKDGTELWSSLPTTIQFDSVSNNIIQTTSSPIQAVNTGNDLDIQFTLSSTIVETQLDRIKNAMEQQGLLGFFQDDITQNREQLQNLIAYHVIRTDVTTGERSDMGVFIGTKFSDRTVGKNTSTPAPQEGHVYDYTINTHFRSAESLIPTYTKTITSPINSSLDYTYKPSKWLHPVTLTEGSLVSTPSLRRNHANTEFTFGGIGDILQLRMDLSTSPAFIYDAIAKTFGKNKVLIQWSLKGSIKKIDHFIVTKEEMGMKTVVGKTHAMSDTNLQFIDTAYSTNTSANPATNKTMQKTALETAVTYYITPVFFDYTHGPSIKTPQTITRKIG